MVLNWIVQHVLDIEFQHVIIIPAKRLRTCKLRATGPTLALSIFQLVACPGKGTTKTVKLQAMGPLARFVHFTARGLLSILQLVACPVMVYLWVAPFQQARATVLQISQKCASFDAQFTRDS